MNIQPKNELKIIKTQTQSDTTKSDEIMNLFLTETSFAAGSAVVSTIFATRCQRLDTIQSQKMEVLARNCFCTKETVS